MDVINEILEAHLQTQQMLLKTQSQAFAWDYSSSFYFYFFSNVFCKFFLKKALVFPEISHHFFKDPRWRSSELNGWNVYDPVKEFARQGVGHTLDSLNSGILGGTNGIGAKYYGRGQLSSSYTGISIPQASLKESGESTDNSPQLGSIASSSPSTGRRIPPSPKRQQFRQLRQQQSQQRQILSTGQRRRQNPNWRISVVNSNYALIPTYPKVFVVPFNMDDAAIRYKFPFWFCPHNSKNFSEFYVLP